MYKKIILALCIVLTISLIIPKTSFAEFKTPLLYGHRSKATTEVQNFLLSQNLYQGKLDGYFGKTLRTSIRNFQKLNHIKPVNGLWNLLTRKTANQILKTSQNPDPTPTPQPPVTTTPNPPIIATGNCPIFPVDNPWNQDISKLAVRSDSTTFITSIGLNNKLHPDFGANQNYGIPYSTVDKNQPKITVHFTAYGDESDPGPYPIPATAPIENGSDHHVIVVDKDNCILYELYNASKNSDNSWNADSAAKFDLRSNNLRKDYWTSADAAGLPIYPGLVKYEEVSSGTITHAIRFTAPRSQRGFIHPATHYAGSNDSSLPPMGLRVRLKTDYDISKLPFQAKVIAQAMKTYGMILADNGSSWYFTGAPSNGWNDDQLNTLKTIPGNAFEAVDTGAIIK